MELKTKERIVKIIAIPAILYLGGVVVSDTSRIVRDPFSLPKHYHDISPQEIGDYDGESVKLSMSPFYFNETNEVIGLREDTVSLDIDVSGISDSGFMFTKRLGRDWNDNVRNAAFDSIERLIGSGHPSPITVRGVLDGNTLNTYSITTGDGTYSLTDKFVGDGQ